MAVVCVCSGCRYCVEATGKCCCQNPPVRDDEPDVDDPIEDRIAYDDPPAYWDRDRTEGA